MTRRLSRFWSHVWDWLVISGINLVLLVVIAGVVVWVQVAWWSN